MTLYIFNPEHDIALTHNLSRFTPPRAARRLRRDLGFLPALWAEEDSVVLVDDVKHSIKAMEQIGFQPNAQFVSHGELKQLLFHDSPSSLRLEPWGWDAAVVDELGRCGVDLALLPSPFAVDALRDMSHRSWAASHLLPHLRALSERIVGEACAATSTNEVLAMLERQGKLVLKQPWSSSGRGVRMVEWQTVAHNAGLRQQLESWVNKCVCGQGCVMMEPLYNKVEDFGMEFRSDGRGHVDYCGLSLFQAERGNYVGNMLAAEYDKVARLTQLGVPCHLLDAVRKEIACIMAGELYGLYCGPFGIDMMVVEGADGIGLHACVELNLRCTMGHAALSLTRLCPTLPASMRIAFDGESYQLIVD